MHLLISTDKISKETVRPRNADCLGLQRMSRATSLEAFFLLSVARPTYFMPLSDSVSDLGLLRCCHHWQSDAGILGGPIQTSLRGTTIKAACESSGAMILSLDKVCHHGGSLGENAA